MSMIQIKNAVLITDDRLIYDKYIYIKDDKIFDVTAERILHDIEVDACGMFVSPGFIDIHAHGGGGYDFADGNVSDIFAAALTHAIHGTTTIYPTCTSSSFDDTLNFLSNVKAAAEQNKPGKPNIAGSHLEGPYFSKAMCGAQNTKYLKDPVRTEYEKFVKVSGGTLKRVSFAPELKGTSEMCRFLEDNNIVTAFGHTEAIYEELKPFLDMGCRLATHLYSGMNGVTRRNMYRKLGAVETAFLEDSVTVEVIADGVHLPPELLRLIYKIKGAEKICMVTDSMRGACMESGRAILGPLNNGTECIVKKDDVAYLPDMSAFAGSVATCDRLVRVMHKAAGIPLPECIKMMSQTPAKTMGLEKCGKICKDYYADIVFFDSDINIKKVIIRGKELEKEGFQV